MIESADSPNVRDLRHRANYRKASPAIGDAPTAGMPEDEDWGLRVHLKDSQLRMAVWLNSLPWKKVLTWYPEISNSHAVIIVRWVRASMNRHGPDSRDELTRQRSCFVSCARSWSGTTEALGKGCAGYRGRLGLRLTSDEGYKYGYFACRIHCVQVQLGVRLPYRPYPVQDGIPLVGPQRRPRSCLASHTGGRQPTSRRDLGNNSLIFRLSALRPAELTDVGRLSMSPKTGVIS